MSGLSETTEKEKGEGAIPSPGLSKTMQAAENRAGQGGKPANEGAYFLYVTEIFRCSQRRKQNYTIILRLRDFFDGLGEGTIPSPRKEAFIPRSREGNGATQNQPVTYLLSVE